MTLGPTLVTGAACGLILAAGLLFIWLGSPRRRRPTLSDRLAPYVRDAMPTSGLLRREPVKRRGVFLTLTRPVVHDLARRVDQLMGGAASVRRRQLRAGHPPDIEAFRTEQVLWGAVGGLVGVVLGLVAVVARSASAVPVVAFVVSAILTGIVGRDQWLSRQARLREQRMLTEFPTVAELLALAVSAGEGATGALDRVCRLSHGELSHELGQCLADARAGANLPTALQGLADRTGLVSLARFVDGMVVAVERGTPLAEVLRAQAQDVREASRRSIMESGGRKEIGMMVPVVFLVLPITVLFAVFPGFALLRLAT
ncbi:MAG TPA: type II secretion system F family protein [Dermatophilaceae bacterium]|nr:type II secretion system F family protein [Dermatophilaceae bacterium]